ncbi:RNA-dependent DNA polymerase [Rhodococcus sp. 06-462-5]|uniref:reverse transcriptase family protein n=1 Tax=unclassified Rhodococcus (in: high G+C Gram-positive bacteria) TaxID=192944 RepID=UPI000B9B2E5D|nr:MULTISPECIES: reverse transcriptase family protein [unclassified Rhodococcus (in: high G+C Gram-positive bacteria)]OZC79358.1 RNA-dependent DNA polymerase [Rhodococcus sp. 06-462-5]OZE59915.1 RNA-dependent DNA polymerase [Rhodococcus sp. 02-925g]
MTERELTPPAAATLARLAADAEWTRSGLEVAFARFVPVKASWLADRVINLYPSPPFDEASIFVLLRDLPFIPEPSVSSQRPTRNSEKPWRFEVPRYETTGQLARSLDLTISEIEWFADLQGRLRTAPFPLQHYRSARLDKRQGIRLLEVPKPRLREIQRKILRRILDRIPAHPAAHGFRTARSPRTFAMPHSERDVVISVDLRRFFPSIGFDRVVAIFEAVGYPRKVAANLAALCTTVTPAAELVGVDRPTAARLRATHLPQGAPTSPALANLAARQLDIRAAGLARSVGARYSRYADDLAFSGGADIDVDRLLWLISQIAHDEGFTIHPDKTRIRRAHQRQQLTGLVVNAWPAVPREEYDNLRALLHNCISTGPAEQNLHDHNDFRAHVYGRIARIGETNETRRAKLLSMASRVNWD